MDSPTFVTVPATLTRSLFHQNPSSRSHCVFHQRSTFVPPTKISRLIARPPQAPTNSPLRMVFGLGAPEVAVIAGVALLIWGPKKLEGMGKELGSLAGSVKKATADFTDAMETSMKEADEEIERSKEERKKLKKSGSTSTSGVGTTTATAKKSETVAGKTTSSVGEKEA